MGLPGGGYGEYWKGFEAGMKEAGLAVKPEEQQLFGGEGAIGGRNVARKLLEWPAAKRPDGLVVVDDRIAMGLAATLVQTDYRPRMVVQTNLQAPLAFALPVVHFEVDADELATRSVNLLLSCLRNPSLWPRREWVKPRILNQAETHMSMSQG
jgi:DNA-binding LacI/PurR family transcriptional regulator